MAPRLLDKTPWAYRAARRLGRWLCEAYYPDLVVDGAGRVPAGPLLVAANHPNSLVDPVVVSVCLPRRIHWLAKATLFDARAARAVMTALGAIPVKRRHEGGTIESTNETLRAAADALVRGKAIGIFPEGLSHDEPRLKELKTGVGRLAVLAARDLADAGTGETLHVLPVVLHFHSKTRFRSAVLVALGTPFGVRGDESAEDVTERVRLGIEELLVHVEDAEQQRLLESVGVLVRKRHATEPVDARELHRVDREVAAAVRRFSKEEPARVAAFSARLRAYLDRLDRHGVSLHALEPSRADPGRTALATLLLPVAAYGLLHSWVPYRLSAWAAGRKRDATVTVTFALLAGMFAFPATWAIVALLVGLAWGPIAGLAFLVTAPLTALAARWSLHVLSRQASRAVDRLLLGANPWAVKALKEQRAELWSEIERWRTLHLESRQDNA